MKLTVLVCMILSFFVLLDDARGQVTIAPATEYTLTQNDADGGSATNNGNVSFILDSSFSTTAKTIKAESSGGLSIGKGVASSQIFYEFQVGSTPATAGNTIGGWINYSVEWKGFQLIISGLGTNASVLVELALRDMTDARNLHVETLHDRDLQTYSIEFIDVGLNLNDSGVAVGTIPAVLKRGHTYRLTLRMSTTLIVVVTTGIQSTCDYMNGFAGGGDGRVELNSLFVKAGIDEKEVLEQIQTFQNHRHIYLTGRGQGHNNVEATSSPPVATTPVTKKSFATTLLEDDVPAVRPEETQTEKPKH